MLPSSSVSSSTSHSSRTHSVVTPQNIYEVVSRVFIVAIVPLRLGFHCSRLTLSCVTANTSAISFSVHGVAPLQGLFLAVKAAAAADAPAAGPSCFNILGYVWFCQHPVRACSLRSGPVALRSGTDLVLHCSLGLVCHSPQRASVNSSRRTAERIRPATTRR